MIRLESISNSLQTHKSSHTHTHLILSIMAFAADMSVFEQSKKTRALHLSGRSLTEVPPAVLAMTDIVRLDLGGNEITALPAALAGLTRLEELWLNGNPIKTIPPSLQHCRALKVLDLRGTKVYELPRELR